MTNRFSGGLSEEPSLAKEFANGEEEPHSVYPTAGRLIRLRSQGHASEGVFMAAKKRGGRPRGGQRPVRGFRPGKEPAHLKKQRAMAQLGSDVSGLQKKTVEAIAGRSPSEVRAMVRRWSLVLIAGAVLLALTGIFLFAWTRVGGVVALVLSLALLFLAYRLRKQGPGLVDMAESLQ